MISTNDLQEYKKEKEQQWEILQEEKEKAIELVIREYELKETSLKVELQLLDGLITKSVTNEKTEGEDLL